MKVDLLRDGSLKILLTEQELAAFGLTFEQLNYADPATRSALHSLLLAAQQQTGFDSGGDLLIEALPVDGGCLLLITPTAAKRTVRAKRAVGPYVYEVASAEALLALAHSLHQRGGVPPHSSLYGFGEGYRLIVYPLRAADTALLTLLSEFAAAVGQGDNAAAYTAEHGRAIAIGDALSRLCAAV